MTKLRRNYRHKTLKILFALSGNRCAYPECTNTIIEPATAESDAIVTGEICHIYAASTAGPRGNPELTQQEFNSRENLILLCRHHHKVVDGQHETYPAGKLKEWKQTHESEIERSPSEGFESSLPDTFSHLYFPIALVNQKIEDDVDTLRKSRFFREFDRVRASLGLARKLVTGELSGGTDEIRARGLARCARILSTTEELDKAEEYLRVAKSLGTGSEIDIADACITWQKGNRGAALSSLASIDSPHSRSAALMIVANHEGAEAAVDWLKTAGIGATDLDSDGKLSLLMQQLKLSRWEAARGVLKVLTDQDWDETPALHHLMAITHLLSTVPVEFRNDVRSQLPFEAAGFPLASNAAAIGDRQAAYRHFTAAAEVARKPNCPEEARVNDKFALWLELRDHDPETSEKGRQRLKAKLGDPKSTPHLVPLGVQFGIKLDLAAVENEIDQQIALHGGITPAAATARLALAFTQNTPKDAAAYIAQRFDELSEHLDKKSLRFLQIEMLSQAGQPERAKEGLNLLLEEGLSEAEESRLRSAIAEAEGADPVETRKAQFERTDSLRDLVPLVGALESGQEWDGLCEYGEILFERTHSLHDAERLANALSNARKMERLVKFLQANNDLLKLSEKLQMLYCWALYHEGEALEARYQLAKLSANWEDPNYRALQVNLGTALGDWHSLSTFVVNEYGKRDKRSAQDLMDAARLALGLDLPHAKGLLFAAAAKGSDDANVLASAHLLAVNAGWEEEEEVSQWLHRAVELSDNDGPIQRVTLKDILDRRPEWDRQASETWQRLSRGEVPIFLAAQFLNKSLIELMLVPTLANLSKSDPRRRDAISAYSGERQQVAFDTSGAVGIEATALLTLSFLNLLDKALDAFETVLVPHSTLIWLFEEKRGAAFHQPSRIREARQVLDLLVTETSDLEKLIPSTVVDSDLSAQVGDELATFIAEAEKVRDDDQVQRIVVRPSPVYRVSSLMEEEADLTGHAAVLSSCLSVVDKLRQKGQITVQEARRARAYLQPREKPWPNQPEITDGAILYLDDLALTYFLDLGILEKLRAAGFRPIVSPGKVSEANELIDYESMSSEVDEAIKHIRSAVSSRIESGKIKLGKRHSVGELEEQEIFGHPTVDVITLAGDCDSIISDDRFLNRLRAINNGSEETPTFSTLDLLDELVSAGSITPEDQLEHRTRLRRAGYFFVPVSEDELNAHLANSTVEEGNVIETAELKAIRENILQVRMSGWLQLPQEAPWLTTVLTVFIRVLKSMWRAGADLCSATAHSNWIMDQVDIRGWVHSFEAEHGDHIVRTGRGEHILMLLSPPLDAPQDVKDAYWSWVEDRVLAPIKEQYPDLYAWLVEQERRRIAEMADMELTEGEQHNDAGEQYDE